MGKVKEFMRSLRARLSTSRSGMNDKSAKSRESISLTCFVRTSMNSGSGSTIDIRATACSNLQTMSTFPLVFDERVCSVTAALDITLSNFAPIEDQVNADTGNLDAHAAFEVNVAMLRLVGRLPLDELRVVGQGSTLSLFLKDDDAIASDSSCSFACCSARRTERDHAGHLYEHDGCVADEQLRRMASEIAEKPPADSRVLSLTSMENSLASSLALQSARQTERDYTQRKRDNEGNLFGGFAGPIDRDKVAIWLSQQQSIETEIVDYISDPQYRSIIHPPIRQPTMNATANIQQAFAGIEDDTFPTGHGFRQPAVYMERAPSFTKRSVDSCDLFLESIGLPVPKEGYRTITDEELDKLPNWSDVENDPGYDVFEIQQSRSAISWPSKSHAKTGNVTTDNAYLQRHSIMTDEEFEALPDWSDVEDDPEYNEVKKSSFTSSYCSSKSARDMPAMIFPAVHIPSGFRGDVADSNKVASRTKPDQGGFSTDG